MENNYLAPNGKKSNLTNSQYKLVRTKAFKEWFGDWENDSANASKVVDENGEPLVVFHGTTSIFNEFRVGRTNGLFFTNKKESANRFSSGDLRRVGDSPRILECFLKINKLYNKNTNDEILVNNYYQDYFEKRPFIKKQSQKNILKDKFNKFFMDLVSFGIINDEPKLFLLKYNYNGIVINSDNNAKSYITFNSNQIKLADGTNTTFDSNNPDIRYKKGGMTNGKASKIDSNELKMNLGGSGYIGERTEFYERTYADGTKERFSIEDYEKNIYPLLEKELKMNLGGMFNEEDDNTFLYKINTELNSQGKGQWEKDFEIIDNRDGQEFGEDASNWIVYNNVSRTSVDAKSKKDAEDIIKNAPAYDGFWNEGEPIDFSELNPKQQANHIEEFNRQKGNRKYKRGGAVGKINYADGRKFRIRVKQKKG